MLLEVEHLGCERGERLLFTGINFSLDHGAVVQIEGRNGAGKTSLLRIVCGLAVPTKGKVRWRGQEIHRQRQEFNAEMLYLGHLPGVKDGLTPEENLKVAQALAKSNIEIPIALRQVGLEQFFDFPAHSLSAGQRRRIALARLVVNHAILWILDEPFTALDRSGITLVEDLITQHCATGGAVLITTHQPLHLENITRINLDN